MFVLQVKTKISSDGLFGSLFISPRNGKKFNYSCRKMAFKTLKMETRWKGKSLVP